MIHKVYLTECPLVNRTKSCKMSKKFYECNECLLTYYFKVDICHYIFFLEIRIVYGIMTFLHIQRNEHTDVLPIKILPYVFS